MAGIGKSVEQENGLSGLYRMLTLALIFTAAPAQATQSTSPFDEVVTALATAPADWRRDFAAMGLSLIVDAYLEEAQLARSDKQEEARKKTRWSGSVERYADQLMQLKLAIEQGQEVDIRVSTTRDVIIKTGGQQVMLSYPRARQQIAFEQRLLTLFCDLRDCGALTMADAPLPEAPAQTMINPDWAFTEDGAECHHQGLRLVFALTENTNHVRSFCEALLGEIETLLTELQAVSQFGVAVELQHLQISRPPALTEHAVKINGSDDTIMLELPLLHQYPRLLPLLQPWLEARLRSETATLTVAATAFGWNGSTAD